jgi:hypothetical protein
MGRLLALTYGAPSSPLKMARVGTVREAATTRTEARHPTRQLEFLT